MPVFISHSHQDEPAHSSLVLALEASGIDCWDTGRLEVGRSLRDELRKAIRDCELCIFLATKRSIESRWCLAEIGAFWGAGKRVIGYLADPDITEAALPPQLQGDLWTRDARKVLATVLAEQSRIDASRMPAESELKAATCALVCGEPAQRSGTGFLIAPNLVVTAGYIVPNNVTTAECVCTASFPGHADHILARLMEVDPARTLAFFRLDKVPVGVSPVRLAASCEKGARCHGFGYPRNAGGTIGIPFAAEVLDANHVDKRGRSVVIQSQLFATGPMDGFGGSPIGVAGEVIGLIHHILSSEDMRALYGIVFAIPADSLQAALARLR